jgi:hypothetical protein
LEIIEQHRTLYISISGLFVILRIVMENQSLYPCPSCGFMVFDEPSGSYDICPVCDWEDDPVQFSYPAMGGGANKESLHSYQQLWIKRIPSDINSYQEYHRDVAWRPLRIEELNKSGIPKTGVGYFESACLDSPQYYWLKDNTT